MAGNEERGATGHKESNTRKGTKGGEWPFVVKEG